jgi:hypothetical protein
MNLERDIINLIFSELNDVSWIKFRLVSKHIYQMATDGEARCNKQIQYLQLKLYCLNTRNNTPINSNQIPNNIGHTNNMSNPYPRTKSQLHFMPKKIYKAPYLKDRVGLFPMQKFI